MVETFRSPPQNQQRPRLCLDGRVHQCVSFLAPFPFPANEPPLPPACLDWWATSGLTPRYSKAALFHLSKVGNVALLDWWKASSFPLAFDKEVLVIATRYGQTGALQWWLESGLEIEYRFFDIEEALEDSVAGKEEAQKWWEKRGYKNVLSGSEWTKPRNLADKRGR